MPRHTIRVSAVCFIASMLLTWHNLQFYQDLMAGLRGAIAAGAIESFAADFLARYTRGKVAAEPGFSA